MRMLNFAKRNFKELIRDPLSLVFEIVLPLFLLFIFQQFNIPEESSPMKSSDYILGYILSLLPIVIIQNVVFFVFAIIMGLSISINILYAILVSVVISILFIGLGILIGSLVSEKATGGLGSIIVQLVCFTSGMYFSNDLVGKGFAFICKILPFESTLNIIKGVLNDISLISFRNIITFAVYTVVVLIISIIVFKKKMVSDNK